MSVLANIAAVAGDPISITTGLTDAAETLSDSVNAALPVALPIGAAILAVTIGWKLFKRFVRG